MAHSVRVTKIVKALHLFVQIHSVRRLNEATVSTNFAIPQPHVTCKIIARDRCGLQHCKVGF